MKKLLFTLLLVPVMAMAEDTDPIVQRYMVTQKEQMKQGILPSMDVKVIRTGGLTYSKEDPHTYPYVDFGYQSVDEKIDTINLSAKMMWKPNSGSDTTIQQNVILYCPYTHFANYERATSDSSVMLAQMEQKYFIWKPNWVIMTDGEGFGASVQHQQMYLNHWLWARQQVDALRAAWRYRTTIKNTEGKKAGVDYPKLADDWKTVICGMSQGGGSALATLRIMETTLCDPNYEDSCKEGETLAEYYRVEMANVCVGPYDPEAVIKTYFNDWMSMDYPCVIPLTLKSYIASYPDVLGEFTDKDFFTDEYIQNAKDEVDAAIDSKKCSSGQVNAIFLKYFAHRTHSYTIYTNSHEVFATEFARPDLIDFSSVASQKLLQCLEYNNVLRGGWKPKSWVKYYYTEKDDIVPFTCTQEMMNVLDPANSSGYNDTYWYHYGSCINWLATSWTEKSY